MPAKAGGNAFLKLFMTGVIGWVGGAGEPKANAPGVDPVQIVWSKALPGGCQR